MFVPTPSSTKLPIFGDYLVNTGIVVQGILRNLKLTTPGKYVYGILEILSSGEMLAIFSEVTGQEAVYIQVDIETHNALWPRLGKLLGENMKLYEALGDARWDHDKSIVTLDDLGLEKASLRGFREAIAKDFAGSIKK